MGDGMSEQTRVCGFCDVGTVHPHPNTVQKFLYGVKNPVELEAVVTLWTCEDCGDSYTDGDAEDVRQAAVDAYLKQNALLCGAPSAAEGHSQGPLQALPGCASPARS